MRNLTEILCDGMSTLHDDDRYVLFDAICESFKGDVICDDLEDDTLRNLYLRVRQVMMAKGFLPKISPGPGLMEHLPQVESEPTESQIIKEAISLNLRVRAKKAYRNGETKLAVIRLVMENSHLFLKQAKEYCDKYIFKS